MDYEIQKLEPENYDKCNNIWDMKRNEYNIKLAKKCYDELVSGNRMIFVYVKDGEYLGQCDLVFDANDSDYTIPDKRIYLSRMIVKPELRNQGIGSKMLDFLINYSKNLGYSEMSLGVDIVNIEARQLYEKKGFNKIIFVGEDEHGKFVKLLKAL